MENKNDCIRYVNYDIANTDICAGDEVKLISADVDDSFNSGVSVIVEFNGIIHMIDSGFLVSDEPVYNNE
jgi:hypothetical protein